MFGLSIAPILTAVLLSEPAALQPWFEKPEWFIVWVTAAYAIVAVFTLGAIAWQTYLMRKQSELLTQSVEVARSSAEAALLSARAVINSERPWMFMSTAVKGSDVRHASISFKAKNGGRTPAEVTVISGSFMFSVPDSLDWTPSYPMPGYELAHKNYVVPGGQLAISDLDGFDCGIIEEEQWKQVNAEGKYLTFYGHIVYRDVIAREEHETRFCYLLSPKQGVGLIVVGPPEWNKHT